MKYKITKFTKEEEQDMLERYGEWMKPENVVWIEREYRNALSDKTYEFGASGLIEINKKLKSFTFAKSYAEKIWTLEKIRDHQYHSSPYIESRIGDYPINDFNDETHQRILLEEMEGGGVDEQGFLSDFIEERIKLENCESFSWEMDVRQKLSDCEMHTTPYVAKRIGDYEFKDLDDEIAKRIKLEECEKLNSKFILKRIKPYMGKINPETELHKRQILKECEKHTNGYVKKRIKEFQPLTLKTENHEDLYEQLQWREDLEQSEEHITEFIEENLKFYKGRGVEIASPTQELEYRLTLEECAKFNTDYISRETSRLKDEYLIRDPNEELKHRMNLAFFEDNVKDKEKIANKDTFWDMISVHGLENMDLLKTELNSVGKGFCLAKWNQVSILLQSSTTRIRT